jgi:hypothetical protein
MNWTPSARRRKSDAVCFLNKNIPTRLVRPTRSIVRVSLEGAAIGISFKLLQLCTEDLIEKQLTYFHIPIHSRIFCKVSRYCQMSCLVATRSNISVRNTATERTAYSE